MLSGEGRLLRIYIGESDRHEGVPLYEWIVRRMRQEGIAGATVLRGVMGFGANSLVHTTRILRLSLGLPLVVEIVDTPEKIEAVLPIIDQVIHEGLVTVERVDIRLYRSSAKG